jgi:hypothetical protein
MTTASVFKARLPRRVFPNRRIQFLIVDEPQDLPEKEQQRRKRMLAKLIQIMGLSRHRRRIPMAFDMISLANTTPKWARSWSNLKDMDTQLAMDVPFDLKCNYRFFTGTRAESASCNPALTYIWLDATWPQEAENHGVLCLCGRPDEVCDDSCHGCRVDLSDSSSSKSH